MDAKSLRNAGPNEKRVIIRHALGFYSNIAVGSIYQIPRHIIQDSQLRQSEYYVSPLISCVQQHPLLSATIRDAETNSPIYMRPLEVNLGDHIRLLNTIDLGLQIETITEDETIVLQQVLERIHNHPSLAFTSVATIPPWSLDVLLLAQHVESDYHRVFVSFTYSHSHGDGMSGVILHQTFYRALRDSLTSEDASRHKVIDCSAFNIYDQPDTSSKMPISLSYLLRPALGTYLPAFLTKWFGIPGNVSGADIETWTGSKTFLSATDETTKISTIVEMFQIEAPILNRVLALCKMNNVKLTALLGEVIAQAMRAALRKPDHESLGYTNLVATIPVNLRKALGEPDNTVGNFGGATYLRWELGSSAPIGELPWDLLRSRGHDLSRVASSTRDQPIGLLRFIANFAGWMQAKIGHPRDCSWELSNLGSVALQDDTQGGHQSNMIHIERMLFSQSASADGPPLTFNTIAVKNGNLNVCVTWQPGALTPSRKPHGDEAPDGAKERILVRNIISSIEDNLEQLANTT